MEDRSRAELHQYEPRSFVVGHSEIIVGENAPDWAKGLAAQSRAEYQPAAVKLVDLVERSEKRVDAQLFREFQVTVPRIFNDAEAVSYLRDVAKFLADKGMMVDLAYHRYGSGHDKSEPLPPDVTLQVRDGQVTPEGDHVLWKGGKWYRYQPHGHLLTVMRPLTERGLGPKRVPYVIDKVQQINAKGRPLSVPTTPWGDRDFLDEVRTAVHVLAREHVKAKGVEYITPWERAHGVGSVLEVEPTLGIDGYQAQRHIGSGVAYQPGQAFYPQTLIDYEAWRSAAYRASIERPELLLNSLTKSRATFSEGDLNALIAKLSRGSEELEKLHRVVMASDHLVALDLPENQLGVFSTRDMYDAEHAALRHAVALHERANHVADPQTVEGVLARMESERQVHSPGFSYTDEQRMAVIELTTKGDFAAVEGFAGTGKTTLLSAVRAVHEDQGYKVLGYTLSQKAASELQAGAGIQSTSVASMLETLSLRDSIEVYADTGVVNEALKHSMQAYLSWQKQGAPSLAAKIDQVLGEIDVGQYGPGTKDWVDGYVSRTAQNVASRLWDRNSVVVLDEFVMIDSRALAKLEEHALESGAALVLSGDREQAQPIAAGGAASRILDYINYARVETIVRQQEEWQRQASRLFATQKTDLAIDAYAQRGFVKVGHQFNESAFRLDVERQVGRSLSDGEVQKVVLLGRYVEARRAAGGILAAHDGSGRNKMPDEFWAWFKKRNDLAAEIGANIDGMRVWLDQFGVGPRLVAVHALQGSGLSREQADSAADDRLKLWRMSGGSEEEFEGAKLKFDLRSGARDAQLSDWRSATELNSFADVIMAAHTNHDVDQLNRAARIIQSDRGVLGSGVIVSTRFGDLEFAAGDRVMFMDNFVDGDLRIQNGRTGVVQAISDGRFEVKLGSNGVSDQVVSIDMNRYRGLTYGYAGTVHKFQGVTADVTTGQFSSGMDRHLSYVEGTRHRAEFRLHASAADAATLDVLKHRASIGNRQDSTLDYVTNEAYQAAMKAQPAKEALDGAIHRLALVNGKEKLLTAGGLPLPETLVVERNDALAALKDAAVQASIGDEHQRQQFVPPVVRVDRLDHSISEARRLDMLDAIEADPTGWMRAQLDRSVVTSESQVRDNLSRLTRDNDRIARIIEGVSQDPMIASLRSPDGDRFFALQDHVRVERSMVASALALDGMSDQALRSDVVTLTLANARVDDNVRGVVAEILTGNGMHLVRTHQVQAAVALTLDQFAPRFGLAVRHLAPTGKSAEQLPSVLKGDKGTIYGVVRAGKTQASIDEFRRTGVVPDDLVSDARKYLMQAAEKAADKQTQYLMMAEALGTGTNVTGEAWLRSTYIPTVERRISGQLLTNRSLVMVHDAQKLGPEITRDLIDYARQQGAKVVLSGIPDHENARSPMRVIEEHLRADGAAGLDGGHGSVRSIADMAEGGRATDALLQLERSGSIALNILHDGHPAGRLLDDKSALVARYVEARGAVAALTSARVPYGDVNAWLSRRHEAVSEIAKDIDSYRSELAAAGVTDAHQIAQHQLQAAGLRSSDAKALAGQVVAEWDIGDGDLVSADNRTIDVRQAARASLVDQWKAAAQQAGHSADLMIVAPSASEADKLNVMARSALKDQGLLSGAETIVPSDHGQISLMEGDRVRFGAHDGFLAVRVGDLGTVSAIHEGTIVVELDRGELVAMPAESYKGLSHGYAVPVGQARDMTTGNAFVLFGSEMSRRDVRTALTLSAEKVQLFAAAADAPDLRVITNRAAPGRQEQSTLDYEVLNLRTASADDKRMDEALSSFLDRVRQGGGPGLDQARSDLISAIGKGSPTEAAKSIRSAMSADSPGPSMARWGRVGTGMLSSAARGDFVGFARSVVGGASMLGKASQRTRSMTPLAAAQREFLAAAGEHRAAKAAGDTARLATARAALGERVMELSMHDQARAAGIAKAMATVDPVGPGAKGWQSAAEAVKAAQGVASIASGIVTGNPFKVMAGIFRAASSTFRTGQGLANQLNKGIDRG